MKLLQKFLPYIFSFTLFSACLYVLLYFYEKSLDTQNAPVENVASRHVVVDERPLEDTPYYVPFIRPNTLYRVIKKFRGRTIYDVHYDFNKYSLRVVPQVKPSKKDEHLIITGCSFTFGEGLNGEDTLPTLIENQQDGIQAYNWGLIGGGIHKTLHHHDFVPLKNYVNEKKGKLIYLFITDHLSRFLATADFLDWAAPSDPYYAVEDSKVIYKGLLRDQTFFKFYHSVAEKSGLKNTNLKIRYLLKNKDSLSYNDLNQFVKAIEHLKEKYLEQFPEGEFIFIFHPLSSPLNQKKELKEILSKRNIKFFDHTDEFYQYVDEHGLKHDDFRIPHDGHPNKKFNEYFSHYIMEGILKRSGEI